MTETSSAVAQEAGSYDFRYFSGPELDRLISQGSSTWEQERELLAWAGMTPGDDILDLGCGPGVISHLITQEIGLHGSVTGIDINDELLSVARQINGNHATFHPGSIYDLGNFRQRFDFIYVRLVLQHVARPLAAIAEIYGALKPGGKVCILDSDESILAIHPRPMGMESLLTETQLLQQKRGGDRFIGGKLASLMKQAGLINVQPRVFLITPELIGAKPFLDTVLTWRPQLYPEAQRESAMSIMRNMYAEAELNMVTGHNGAFVVKGQRPPE